MGPLQQYSCCPCRLSTDTQLLAVYGFSKIIKNNPKEKTIHLAELKDDRRSFDVHAARMRHLLVFWTPFFPTTHQMEGRQPPKAIHHLRWL